MLQLIVYVPLRHADKVKEAIFDAGAGTMGLYDRCCWETIGRGQFRPLAGADPFVGTVGEVETVDEVKIETVCPASRACEVERALRRAHPYEEPAFGFFRMFGGDDAAGSSSTFDRIKHD